MKNAPQPAVLLRFFPTCQVRITRLYQRCIARRFRHARASAVSSSAPSPAPDCSGHCQTSSASSRSQWALPDFSRERQIRVGTAGLQPQAPDRSGHCQTSVASSRSQWALPDFNLCTGQIECQKECQNICQIECPDRMPGRMSEYMSDRMSEYMPDRLPDRMSEQVPD